MVDGERVGLGVDVPAIAVAAGFCNHPIGTHTGKTMMLAELRLLLEAVPGLVAYSDYERAVVEQNALAKATAVNRSNTIMYLKQLYGLRPELPVFTALRELWPVRKTTQPALALLCASARDVFLRTTVDVVLGAKEGTPIGAHDLSARIAEVFRGRYSANTLRAIGAHLASSWAQAGFLAGRWDKRRSHPVVDFPAVVYALYLGHLEGTMGPSLFATRWAHLLDTDGPTLRAMAEDAARSGWLEYRSSGGMTDLSFHHLDDVAGRDGA